MCNLVIDIPAEFESTKRFQGTIGHKVNHKFDPNSIYIVFDSPRYGIINALQSKIEIKQDEEFFANYGYQPESAPNWYIDLFLEFAKENVVGEEILQRYKITKQMREQLREK